MVRQARGGQPGNLWPGLHAALTYLAMLAAIGCIFVYVPTEKAQGIVQRIFYFHVSSALTMFVAFFVVFIAQHRFLVETRPVVGPRGPWAPLNWSVLFCTLVLITGPIWGRPIWGVWWTWDPTLTLTLVLWLIYVAYLMLRADPHRHREGPALRPFWASSAFIDVPLIRWSIEKWRNLPP